MLYREIKIKIIGWTTFYLFFRTVMLPCSLWNLVCRWCRWEHEVVPRTSSHASSLPPGTAAPKTWASSQQKPSPSTGSCLSTTSSRRTSAPPFAPWGFLLLPTPDWRAGGPRPTPCAPRILHPQRTTSPPEGPARAASLGFPMDI